MIGKKENNRDTPNALPVLAETTGRRVDFDYLRTFLVFLVLQHHAILAYTRFAKLNFENPLETFSPVVDSQQWAGFNLMAGANSSFFMSLLFFISGLFVWRSLARKGVRKYLVDRLKRLGIPLVLGVPFLIPLACYPTRLEIGLILGECPTYRDYWLEMIRTGIGAAGPLWFLWLLLTFDCLAAVLYRVAPRPSGTFRTIASIVFKRPVAFFGVLLGISAVAYLPMLFIFGPLQWIGVGPFRVQGSRILHYLVYFLAGTAAGAYGLDRGMFNKTDNALARYWWIWLIVGHISLAASYASISLQLIFRGLAFTVSCATISLGIIAIFLRFVKRRVGILDSLNDNAYGIYIVHYVFVTWLQYWLLGTDLNVIIKASVVLLGTLIFSWGLVAAIRRIPAVAKII